nr:DUF4159 domain-containing protein [Shimia aestuarii]
MMGALSIGFTTPWLLYALLALPVLWILLRAIPPAPIVRRFPGVALLIGLTDEDTVTDRTPWWLLLLRALAIAALILGLAGPVLNPEQTDTARQDRLLVLLDGGWGAASNWRAQMAMLDTRLDEAHRAGREVALVQLTSAETPRFQPAATWQAQLAGISPSPWQPLPDTLTTLADALPDTDFDTLWMSDGLENSERRTLLAALEDKGRVEIVEGSRAALALAPTEVSEGILTIEARRAATPLARDITVEAHGLDPSGAARVLATAPLSFAPGDATASTDLSLPAELRARISRFEIAGQRSAAAVSLSDDSLRRREVALIAGRESREGLELLSPLHYLRQALSPNADILEGALSDVLPANPDVIVLADVATLSDGETADLSDWIAEGGLLLRFAGPRLAAASAGGTSEDPLLPVRLRAGGRSVGGAMSWGEPKALAPFPAESPFHGLPVPDEVRIEAQVMAQPDPNLASRVIAELSDGTPLVTRKRLGEGQVVLFHVTANAEWSGLPLSGLFVRMLDRLAILSATTLSDEERLAGTTWQPVRVLDGFGRLQDDPTLVGVSGEDLATAPLGPALRPGLYRSGARLVARNVIATETELLPANWPAGTVITGFEAAPERPLAGPLLAGALALLLLDILASLAVSGRLRGARAATSIVLLLALPIPEARADERRAIADTREVVLAHVLTGTARIDDTAHAGLLGLSETLFFRTSVEPTEPAAINLETDEIALYPLLYWPITPDQPIPSDEAYAKLNAYLRAGGMILFDTRDADVARFGSASPNGRKLQRLAAPLDIPPLEPVPGDHVLTRTFYLLQDFPGRYTSRDVWVEAAPADAEKIEGMPFRNLNDGVTPVVIGGNDWAAAWAMDRNGNALYPVGRGRSGERQRELAYRFGVNLVMHVLTGNYKSDQVHVPALLDRLGQ